MIEQWKSIKDYENYQVSNLGRVKSLNYRHTGKEKILKADKDKDGYLRVVFCKNGQIKKFLIHRLVATMFIENPENKPFINHIDCNPSNNNVDNLEWCTQKENMQYASKLGRLKSAKNLKNVSVEQHRINSRINGKKCSKPVIAINLTTKEETYFDSQKEASRQLHLSQGNISNVLKGKLKKTGNYTFKHIEED